MRKTARFFSYGVAFFTTTILFICAQLSLARPPLPPRTKALTDLVYKQVGGHALLLDLFLPEEASEPLPLIIYIHGGGWERGSRHQCPALSLIPKGFAVASIDYRFSQEAPFPAQIEDCKAAVRWLRANAAKYNLDPERFGAWGTSAGAHLAALLGTSGGVKELEGDGDNLQYSSRVQAVCASAAPSDLTQFGMDGSDGTPARPRIGQRGEEALTSLFGGSKNKGALAAMASPIRYISADDPPFLLVHGAEDRVVPVEQSRRFYAALQKAGVTASLKIIPNQGHQGALWGAVPDAEAFFESTLKKR